MIYLILAFLYFFVGAPIYFRSRKLLKPLWSRHDDAPAIWQSLVWPIATTVILVNYLTEQAITSAQKTQKRRERQRLERERESKKELAELDAELGFNK